MLYLLISTLSIVLARTTQQAVHHEAPLGKRKIAFSLHRQGNILLTFYLTTKPILDGWEGQNVASNRQTKRTKKANLDFRFSQTFQLFNCNSSIAAWVTFFLRKKYSSNTDGKGNSPGSSTLTGKWPCHVQKNQRPYLSANSASRRWDTRFFVVIPSAEKFSNNADASSTP